MNDDIHIGIKGSGSCMVNKDNTAKTMESGDLDVFATPSMIALIEKTASNIVKPFLEEGKGTVGTMIQVNHTAATPIGVSVNCKCELVAIDNRKLTFNATVYDEFDIIGSGTHERFIIDNSKFMEKANKKQS